MKWYHIIEVVIFLSTSLLLLLEGHHISVSYYLHGSGISMSPLFQGSVCWALHKYMSDNSFPLPQKYLKPVGLSIHYIAPVKVQSLQTALQL